MNFEKYDKEGIEAIVDAKCEGKSIGYLLRMRQEWIDTIDKKNPIIIPLASGKGGVGKTNLAVALSLALNDFGWKVALVDLDPLSNTHLLLGLEKEMIKKTIYDDITCNAGLEEIAHRIYPDDPVLSKEYSQVYFFPGMSAKSVQKPEFVFKQYEKLLRHLLDSKQYNCIVLDLPAGADTTTLTAFSTFLAESSDLERLVSKARLRRVVVVEPTAESYQACKTFLNAVIARELAKLFDKHLLVSKFHNSSRNQLTLSEKIWKVLKESNKPDSLFAPLYIARLEQIVHENAADYPVLCNSLLKNIAEYLKNFNTGIICNRFGRNKQEAEDRYSGKVNESLGVNSLVKYYEQIRLNEASSKKIQQSACIQLQPLGYCIEDPLLKELEDKGIRRSFYVVKPFREPGANEPVLAEMIRDIAKKLQQPSEGEAALLVAINRINEHIQNLKQMPEVVVEASISCDYT
ncbi:MAG: AAA family ATPase [Candidatus Woesearchaeota archaeon]